MASIDWKKVPSLSEAKAIIRHNDYEERTKEGRQHSNTEIDKSKSSQNTSINGLSYKEACNRLEDRIQYLDEHGNTNKRKDRVTYIALNIPAPLGLSEENEEAWFRDVTEIVGKRYGLDNIIEGYIHRDEKHQYKDVRTGEIVWSRSHLHLGFVPELNGKLDAKHIMTRSEMRQLNRLVDAMTKEKYNTYFLDGTYQTSMGDVEALKTQSALLEIEDGLERNRQKTTERLKLENEVYQREKDVQKREDDVFDREMSCKAKEKEISDREQNCNVTEERQRRIAEEQQRIAEQQRRVTEQQRKKEEELQEKENALKAREEKLGIVEAAHRRDEQAERAAANVKRDTSRFDRTLY